MYTNSCGKDTVRNAFYVHSEGIGELYIASPFFSDETLLPDMLDKGYSARLIVRLGPTTSPLALQNLVNRDRIKIRYFTSQHFHSKLYIFGDRIALVGSANFTHAGLQSNREICISISCEDERFDKLVSLFQSYWNQAEVLTPDRVEQYRTLHREFYRENSGFEQSIIRHFGDVLPREGIQVGKKRAKRDKLFLESYRRTYQEFLDAYHVVQNIYEAYGRRKAQETMVPLRIEIDQFFSFIRETFAGGQTYEEQPLRYGKDLSQFVEARLDDWFVEDWEYLHKTIPSKISQARKFLGARETIQAATKEELLDALEVCHSFSERKRFFLGGRQTLRAAFLKDNELERIKKVLSYLLYGQDDFVERMGKCIFDSEYSLNHIGRSVIQELLGWVNKENIPICNGRTVKALRYLGLNVVIFN